MALSDRAARGVLLALGGLLAGAVLRFDLATATNGTFWSDGATYHAMALSLAEDRDLRFDARDVFRVRRESPGGPQGIFLRSTQVRLRCDSPRAAPFGRGSVVWEGPLHVPADATDDQIAALIADWSARLSAATRRAEALVGRPAH